MAEDVRKTGPIGLKAGDTERYLQHLKEKQMQDVRDFLAVQEQITNNRKPGLISKLYSPQVAEPIGDKLLQAGYGNSQYDKGIMPSELSDINEYRAENQPWYDKIANSTVKLLSKTATTTLDGTIGVLFGLAQGVENLIDDDPNTGFWNGIWNNAFTNAMAYLDQSVEDGLQNYRTQFEQNATIFQKMGTLNFWFDDIMKNAGFTIGSIAAMYLTGGFGTLLKGIGAVAKFGATKAGKFASTFAKLFAMNTGEASLESLNTYRDSYKALMQNLNARKELLQQQAAYEYQQDISSGMDPATAQLKYNNSLNQLENDQAAYEQQATATLLDECNGVFAVNQALLSISNLLSFGSLIKGGYGNAKSLLEKAVKTIDGEPVTSTKDLARGLLEGTLKFNVKEIENGAAKVAGRAALIGTQEGFFEEGGQGLASTTAQIHSSAEMNKWAREHTIFGNMVNPAAAEELVDITKALGRAYEDEFGTASSKGWTEVAAGFITGIFGVPFVHRNEQGNIRPTWHGGLREAYEGIYGEQKAVQAQIDLLNKYMSDTKFSQNVRNAIQNMVLNSTQNEALFKKDISSFKDAELEMLQGNALFARDMGLLDAYLEMYNLIGDGLNDQDILELRALAKDKDHTESGLPQFTDDELKERYASKAKRAKEKIEKIIESYDKTKEKFGDSKELNGYDDDIREMLIKKMSYWDTLIWDLERRKQLAAERRQDIMNEAWEKWQSTKNEDEESSGGEAIGPTKSIAYQVLSPSEYAELDNIDRAIAEIDENLQETREIYDDAKKNLKKYADIAVRDRKEGYDKIVYMQAENAIKAYQKAETLGDMADIYYRSPQDSRDDALDQAINNAEDEEQKEKLKGLKSFLRDTNAAHDLIDDLLDIDKEEYEAAMKEENEEEEEDVDEESLTEEEKAERKKKEEEKEKKTEEEKRAEKRERRALNMKWQTALAIHGLVDQIAQQMLKDSNLNTSRLKELLKEKLAEVEKTIEENNVDDLGLKQDEEGAFTTKSVQDAIDTGKLPEGSIFQSGDEMYASNELEGIFKKYNKSLFYRRVKNGLQRLIDSLDGIEKLEDVETKKKKGAAAKRRTKEEEESEEEEKGTKGKGIKKRTTGHKAAAKRKPKSLAEKKKESKSAKSKKSSTKKAKKKTEKKENPLEKYFDIKYHTGKKSGVVFMSATMKDENDEEAKNHKKSHSKMYNMLGGIVLPQWIKSVNVDGTYRKAILTILKNFHEKNANARKLVSALIKQKDSETDDEWKERVNKRMEEIAGWLDANRYKKTDDEDENNKLVQETTDRLVNIAEITLCFSKNYEKLFEQLDDMFVAAMDEGYDINHVEQPDEEEEEEEEEEKKEKKGAAAKPAANKKPPKTRTASSVSFKGNTFDEYVAAELEKGHIERYAPDGSVQKWLADQGISLQQTIDYWLHHVTVADQNKSADSSTKIYYLTHEDQPNVIFLGAKISNLDDDAIGDSNAKTGNMVPTQDFSVCIIGTFGYPKDASDSQKESFNSLLAELQQERSESKKPSKWIVSKHTNRIKGHTGGRLITRMENDDAEQMRNLSDLLKDNKRNPFGLTADTIKWCVVLGEEGKVRMHNINTTDDDDLYPLTGEVMPGQVYMYMPLANGSYMPIQVESVFLPQLFKGLDNWKDMAKLIERNGVLTEIDSYIESLSDPNVSEESKIETMEYLNKRLIFSRNNSIYFNPTGGKYSNSYGENNIYVTIDGQSRELIDFNGASKSDISEFKKTLWMAILQTNPRINIDKTTLDRNAGYYVRTGIIRTNAALLAGAGSTFTLYPIKDDFSFLENNTSKKTRKCLGRSPREKEFLNGNTYYLEDGVWYDSDNMPVSDDTQISLVHEISQGKHEDKLIKIKKGKKEVDYYVFDDTVYVPNGHGGFDELEQEAAQKVIDAYNEQKGKKKKAGRRKAADKTESPVIRKGKKKAAQPVQKGEEKVARKSEESFDDEFNKPKGKSVVTEDWWKPWRSDKTKENKTRRIYIKGKEEKGYFEVVKDIDIDDGHEHYSVHFKPVDKNNPKAFTDSEKRKLFKAMADIIPAGAVVNTWGSITPGGIAGLERLMHLGFIASMNTRLLKIKDSDEQIEIPFYIKGKTDVYEAEMSAPKPNGAKTDAQINNERGKLSRKDLENQAENDTFASELKKNVKVRREVAKELNKLGKKVNNITEVIQTLKEVLGIDVYNTTTIDNIIENIKACK